MVRFPPLNASTLFTLTYKLLEVDLDCMRKVLDCIPDNCSTDFFANINLQNMSKLIQVLNFFCAELISFTLPELYHYCEMCYLRAKKPGDESPITMPKSSSAGMKFREGKFHPENLILDKFEKLRYILYMYFRKILDEGLA